MMIGKRVYTVKKRGMGNHRRERSTDSTRIKDEGWSEVFYHDESL